MDRVTLPQTQFYSLTCHVEEQRNTFLNATLKTIRSTDMSVWEQNRLDSSAGKLPRRVIRNTNFIARIGSASMSIHYVMAKLTALMDPMRTTNFVDWIHRSGTAIVFNFDDNYCNWMFIYRAVNLHNHFFFRD